LCNDISGAIKRAVWTARAGFTGTTAANSRKNPRPFQAGGDGLNAEPIVVIDHAGKNGLDAAAYFMGHWKWTRRCGATNLDKISPPRRGENIFNSASLRFKAIR
jgi:hypothetical protein